MLLIVMLKGQLNHVSFDFFSLSLKMPLQLNSSPVRLEDQCLYVYLNYLHDEVHFLYYLQNFENRSVLMAKHGLIPDLLRQSLQNQLSHRLKGILHDIVTQKMLNILISRMSKLIQNLDDMLKIGQPPQALYSREDISEQDILSCNQDRLGRAGSSGVSPGVVHQPNDMQLFESNITGLLHMFMERERHGNRRPYPFYNKQMKRSESCSQKQAPSYRNLPVFQLFELILHKDTQVIDFSQNKQWVCDPMSESSRGSDHSERNVNQVAKTLWKIVADKCHHLVKFVVPKELSYFNTMDGIILNGKSLTHLTLKRNVPYNMFLQLIGQNCPNLEELDIAGADIVTDFGVVCLLFNDPEQIFMECWNRERTVGSIRRAVRSFPHPHFDKPIPDPTEVPSSGSGQGKTGSGGSNQFLHLKKSFHDAIREGHGSQWELLPISQSLLKLRLENTKVKGDGASVVLECCPNLYSLGYLVFAAAGLKQVYGYEEQHDTKFTEIFYRGPSDQKLQTISNCCRNLRTMFLGSNNVRRLNHSVFPRWERLEYLTLENIIFEDVPQCLEVIGRQLKGLKIQCSGFDVTDIAIHCPNLESLIIQKESPQGTIQTNRIQKLGLSSKVLFSCLKHLEVTSMSFPTNCFTFIAKVALNLRTVKIFSLNGGLNKVT